MTQQSLRANAESKGKREDHQPYPYSCTQSSRPCNISLSSHIAQKPPWNPVKPCRCQGAHCGCGVYASEAGLCRLTVYEAPAMQALRVVLLSRDMFHYVLKKKREISMLFREKFDGKIPAKWTGHLARIFGMTLSVWKNTEVFMEVQEAQRFLLCMELMIRRAQEDTESGLC